MWGRKEEEGKIGQREGGRLKEEGKEGRKELRFETKGMKGGGNK